MPPTVPLKADSSVLAGCAEIADCVGALAGSWFSSAGLAATASVAGAVGGPEPVLDCVGDSVATVWVGVSCELAAVGLTLSPPQAANSSVIAAIANTANGPVGIILRDCNLIICYARGYGLRIRLMIFRDEFWRLWVGFDFNGGSC